MRTTFEVVDEEEAQLIRAGLEDPETRALVKVIGVVGRLPSLRARARVLWCVRDYLDEQRETEGPAA